MSADRKELERMKTLLLLANKWRRVMTDIADSNQSAVETLTTELRLQDEANDVLTLRLGEANAMLRELRRTTRDAVMGTDIDAYFRRILET